MVGKHDHGDSKLTCIDCGDIICAKCLVQCPVGFRCKKCTGKFSSHLIVVSPWIVARTALTCIALGIAYGYLMPGGGLGWFGFLVPYFVGALLGKLVHRVAGYKLGKKVVSTIVCGLIVGMILSPLSSQILEMGAMLFNTTPNIDGETPAMGAASYLLYTIGPAAIFVFGILSPIVNGYRRVS